MDIETKICTRCGVEKPIEKFQLNKLKGQSPAEYLSVINAAIKSKKKEKIN